MPKVSRSNKVSDGSVHHIVQRGVNKRTVFNNPQDYEMFESILKRYLKKFSISIHNYSLMPSHIHILAYIKERLHLSKFMQGVLLVWKDW